jgi:hypothetical protein
MKAVQRINRAWRRFFFIPGCNASLHTVILNSANSRYARLMFGSGLRRAPFAACACLPRYESDK